MRENTNITAFGCCILSVLVLLLLPVGPAAGQDVAFEALVPASDVNTLLVHDGLVIGGLDGGGLALWPQTDPDQPTQVAAGRELSGNRVVDLAWTGAHVWVATDGGGLTRITDIGTDPQYRQFTSVLGGLNLTAVAGAIVGGAERVYYGIADGGVGEITNGVGGAVYTAAQDGLVDDNANALIMYEGDLFVGTDVGVSLFSQNAFSTHNGGLTNTVIKAFAIDEAGDLLAGGNGGVYRWNAGGQTWNIIGSTGAWIVDLATGEGQTWALGLDSVGESRLSNWTGSNFETVALPYPFCGGIAMGSELWIGGRWREASMAPTASLAYVGRHDGGTDFATWVMNSTMIRNPEGVTMGTDGRLWIGDWSGDAVSVFDGERWDNLYEIATVENDSSGLFNHSGNVLCMTTGIDGTIWFNQFFSGILPHDPQLGTTELIYPANSELPGDTVVRMRVHPDGTLIVMHDNNDEGLVEVVTNPTQWRDPSNWLALPEGSPGLANGLVVWDAVVERPDVIWFAVADVGLVRWDINGYGAGPDDPITWHDQSDDAWLEPIEDFLPATANDPAFARGLALSPEGDIWVGGNGLTRFHYTVRIGHPDTMWVAEAWTEKTTPAMNGLVNASVLDVAVDGNGDCWAATSAGLNRVRRRGETVTIDAWMDGANYYSNSTYEILYSPNVITALPGRAYRRLAVSADGRTLGVTADLGAALITVSDIVTESGGTEISKTYFYPNPVNPGNGDAQLKLGGIAADASTDDPAVVEIYNLEGQLVFRDRYVTAGVGFWNGTNRYGKLVVTGMYVVRTTWRNQYNVQSLSVVR